ncbi:MAG: DegT/DnrJ/EryC1/StrS family aminotransferase [Burkholderiaceae bacterium]
MSDTKLARWPEPIAFIDLQAQQARIRASLDCRIAAVLRHGRYIMGPEVAELEARLAEFVGVRHAIGVSDGTTALMLALMALRSGLATR